MEVNDEDAGDDHHAWWSTKLMAARKNRFS